MRHSWTIIAGGLVIIALIGGLFYWYLTRSPRPVDRLVPPTEVTETTGIIEEDGQFYEIKAEYPRSTPLRASAGTAADAEAVAILKGFEENQIASFKERGSFDALSEEDKEMMGYNDGRKQALSMTYKEFSSPETVSYVISIYEDTLGAHGNTYFRTFTFDLERGESLHLEDVFAPNAEYLDLLSLLSREKLGSALGDFADTDYIESGTLPVEESFQNWYLGGDALVLLFPPYQVAAYAAGPQEVRITRAELGTAIAPEYR